MGAGGGGRGAGWGQGGGGRAAAGVWPCQATDNLSPLRAKNSVGTVKGTVYVTVLGKLITSLLTVVYSKLYHWSRIIY